jgi:NRPS condensation-like uncharacterized protein
MQGRMNSMQKSMLQWNELYPYSAVHIVQLGGVLDADRLQACINGTVRKHGLNRLRLDCKSVSFEYEGDPGNCEIQIVNAGERVRCALVAEIERQLNLPFDHTQTFNPFRFLIAAAGNSFFLGVVYFHPVADAESVVWLLKDIAACYRAGITEGLKGGFDLYPDSRAHLLLRHPVALTRKILSLPVQARNLQRSCRARFRDANNLANGFDCFSLQTDELHLMLATAKRWSVTVNDLLLAILLKSLSPFSAERIRAHKRRMISLGCIVNQRNDLGLDGKRVFGVFLGSFTITHAVPEGISLKHLAQDVAAQTARIKLDKLYLASPLELELARFAFGRFSLDRRKKFYAKFYPLWGGITNMNLNRLWDQNDDPAPMDYFRGVSTGPVTPLALSVTTVGQGMNLGLSYRTTTFSREEIASVQSNFREQVGGIQQAA